MPVVLREYHDADVPVVLLKDEIRAEAITV